MSYASLTSHREEIKRILQTPLAKLQRVVGSCQTCDMHIEEVGMSHRECLHLVLRDGNSSVIRGIQCVSCKGMFCIKCVYKEFKFGFDSLKVRFEVTGVCKKCNAQLTPNLMLVSEQKVPASRLSDS